MDTTDGAPLYPGGVGYVNDRPDVRILGTVAVLGALVGLGVELALVGRALVVVVGGGGVGLFVTGDRRVIALRVRLKGEPFLLTFF